jgi:hypothetical protein
MLFSPLVTAATAVLLASIATRLGYGRGTALALGLLYGVATFAWPYTKSLFPEPPSALALVLALWLLVRFAEQPRARVVLTLGIVFGLAFWIKGTNLAVLPVAAAFVGWRLLRSRAPLRTWLVCTLAGALPVVVAALVWAAFNVARFGDPLQAGYNFGFTNPILHGLYGLLLSPGKGFFWYSPLLLGALLAAPAFLRRHGDLGWLILAFALVQVPVYAAWRVWTGGWAWGPRFLLPAAPFVALLLLPLLARWLRPGAGWRGRALAASIGLSVALQLEGLAVHYAVYLTAMVPLDRVSNALVVNSVWASPLLGQTRYLQPRFLDLAWLALDDEGVVAVNWQILIPLLAATLAAFVALWWLWRDTYLSPSVAGDKGHPTRRSRDGDPDKPLRYAGGTVVVSDASAATAKQGKGGTPRDGAALRTPTSPRVTDGGRPPSVPLVLAGLVVLVCGAVSLRAVYLAEDPAYRRLVQALAEEPGASGYVFSNYAREASFLNLNRSRLPGLGLPDETKLTERAALLLRSFEARVAPADGRSPWVALHVAQARPGDADTVVERWLAGRGYPLEPLWFGNVRVNRFLHPAVAVTGRNLQARFGEGMGLQHAAWSGPVEWNGARFVPVALTWKRLEGMEDSYEVVVQLLDARGALLAQSDGVPSGGAAPTAQWDRDEDVTDNHLLPLPPRFPAGEYALVVSAIDPRNAQRLAVSGAEPGAERNTALLARLQVQ